MSDEGIRLVSRVALAVVLILIGALVRTMIGPSKARGRVMAVGQISGLVLGVLLATPVSRSLGTDLSAIGAVVGMLLGWAVSWRFARQIPRNV